MRFKFIFQKNFYYNLESGFNFFSEIFLTLNIHHNLKYFMIIFLELKIS